MPRQKARRMKHGDWYAWKLAWLTGPEMLRRVLACYREIADGHDWAATNDRTD